MDHDTRQHPLNRWNLLSLAAAIIVLALALRLSNLDQLPGEVYGDIIIVYEYTANVLTGQWPVQFVLSAGPLYHYGIAPIVGVAGLHYLGLKLASVFVSLGVLAVTALLSRALLNDELALLSLFVASVSSWLLIFSRLGNSQILVPVLTGGAVFLAVRAVQSSKLAYTIGCAAVAVAGVYTYPQNFILPVVIFLTLLALGWPPAGQRWQHLLAFIGTSLLGSVPFVLIVAAAPENFFSGYIGEKLPSGSGLVDLLIGNIWRSLLSLHIYGDVIFRSNPTSLPHLDWLSGVLFIAGVVFWLQPRRRRWGLALLLPLVLLQVPAMLVRYPDQVPSASRTLGIVPMAYTLVASGLWWFFNSLRRVRFPIIAPAVLVLLLLSILGLNMQRYFWVYANGLPNHNTPFGGLIADYIDALPDDTHAYLLGCCWGEWGQPEPKGVVYEVADPQQVTLLDLKETTCDAVFTAERPSVVIWRPDDTDIDEELRSCLLKYKQQHTSHAWLRPSFA
ncbi:MAG: hypothetical protein HC837_09345 [Chloroflexaceae bacterium]|nr:hypothetical protein [Chloroflexaceae bacterium]